MAKNLVHSFYYILYKPKGVPSSSHNFSGTGGSWLSWLIKIMPKFGVCRLAMEFWISAGSRICVVSFMKNHQKGQSIWCGDTLKYRINKHACLSIYLPSFIRYLRVKDTEGLNSVSCHSNSRSVIHIFYCFTDWAYSKNYSDDIQFENFMPSKLGRYYILRFTHI